MKRLNAFALAATFALAAASTAHANIVTNGDFETGNTAGWANQNFVSGAFNGFTPFGNFALYGGCVGILCDTSQVLATVAGATYTFSFEYGSDGNLANQFIALWDGVAVFQTINDTTNTRPGYAAKSFTVVASSASTVINFRIRNDPTWQSLDNVSVTQAVPEPTSLALVGIALAGFGAASRKKRAA